MKSKYVFAVFAMLLGIVSPVSAADLLYVSLNYNYGGSDTRTGIVSYDTSSNDPATIELSRTTFAASNSVWASDIAFDSNGGLYVANMIGNTVSKFNSSGAYLGSLNTNLDMPLSLAFNPSSDLYVLNDGNGIISIFDSSGAYVRSINPQMVDTGCLAFDSKGNLYVSSGYKNSGVYSINKFDASGTYLSSITTNLNDPLGMTFDSSGNLYVTNLYGNNVSKYDSSGAYQGSITTSLNMPLRLAFDSTGNLYVANIGNSTISKFNSAGTYLTSWSAGTATVRSLAFRPITVPEPSAYALAAIATCMMVYVVRRRNLRPLA